MRLSSKEHSAIVKSFKECLPSLSFKLFLFGSRTDDKKKGGDIDLLIIVEPTEKDGVVSLKSKIRNKIFESISEQKIDITVATKDECDKDLFLSTILPGSIILFESLN